MSSTQVPSAFRSLVLALSALASGCLSDGGPIAGADPAGWGRADGFGEPDTEVDGGPLLGSEEDLAERLDPVLLPYYREAQVGWLVAGDGVRLHYVRMPPPAGVEEVAALVLLTGRAESHCKYVEVLHDLRHLREAGVTIAMMDHRGQGFSDRMHEDPEAGFVGAFQDYVDDLATFVDTVVRDGRGDLPLLGLGHSMGGAVLATYAVQHPGVFDAVVLASPMLQIDFGEDYSESSAYWIAWAAPDSMYAAGQGPFVEGRPFEGNDVTHSRARFELAQRVFEVVFPEARLGGPTFGWLEQSIEATRSLRQSAARLTTPTLLLQASDDTVVVPAAQTAFCAEAPSCRLVAFPGARHELLMETDEIRHGALRASLEFLFPEAG